MSEPQQQVERRYFELSDEQLEKIAVRAAQLVTESVYIEVGKQTLRGVLLVVGSATIAFLTWLGLSEKIFK